MGRLYMITVPGLAVSSDWAAVHDRLLNDFPDVIDVLATTIPATVLVVYKGRPEIDSWLAGISDAVLGGRPSAGRASPPGIPPVHGPRARAISPNHPNNRKARHAAARLLLRRSS